MMPDVTNQTAEEFWQEIYDRASSESSGRPSQILETFAKDRPTGQALDLGCAKGDDAVWLAKNGWQSLGVDIAAAAIKISTQNASRNGVADRARFERHDLSKSFPVGTFDLVSGMFLQTPFRFPRRTIMQRAAQAVRPNGLLLMATHQTLAPWSWSDPDTNHPDALARLADMQLDPRDWRQIHVGPIERIAVGKDGQSATVVDAVVALERL
ncbi:MAG: SAM-dependent methyltransferase [Pelagimonas sp.]|uniref:SAM-dependent methyltransferase n=1 Tax=Pelagimonas sp. TaxID=2073170 RepID=UPI003D6A5A6C